MDGLVAVRSNMTGQMSPTPEARAAVAKQLAETAAARAGERAPEDAILATAGTSANAVVSRASETSSSGSSTSVVPKEELGKDAFLQLLVLQMKTQDPLNPMDNTDMIAQLAQFSALEAQTNLNEAFATLSGNVDQLNFISGAQMLGKTVIGLDVDGEQLTGVVDSVHLDGSLVMLNVGGKLMSMASVFSVTAPAADTSGGSTP